MDGPYMAKEFRGVTPPIITPFKPNYELDEEGLKKIIGYLADNGVHGVIPLGSTGEFARLSLDERKRIISLSVEAAKGRTHVIAGTASASTREAAELSKYAQDSGADGLQIVAPFYGHFTDEELYQHYKAISEQVDVPIFIYNNPWASGNDINPQILSRLSQLPNIVAVKEASGDSRRISEIKSLTDGKFAVFAGNDDNTLECFALGAIGWVAGVANFLPRQCVEFYDIAVGKRDFVSAREYWSRHLYRVGALLESSGKFVQYIKYGCELMDLPAGPVRPPLLGLSDGEKAGFKDLLRECELL